MGGRTTILLQYGCCSPGALIDDVDVVERLPSPLRDSVMSVGRICLRGFAAQLVSAPVNRRYASGRLG